MKPSDNDLYRGRARYLLIGPENVRHPELEQSISLIPERLISESCPCPSRSLVSVTLSV